MNILFSFLSLIIILQVLNKLSYTYLKNRVIKRRRWDLNICCGRTDGGGVNADVRKYTGLPNFILISDIYHLPFRNRQFDYVLCSHTIEHVSDPKKFFAELQRVGKNILITTPPLWDLWAVLNFTVHKWIVLSFRKEHTTLPRMVPYPLGLLYHDVFGQRITT